MIQDITPHTYDPVFRAREPKDQDYVLYYEDDKVMLGGQADGAVIPSFEDLKRADTMKNISIREKAQYLFSIDNRAYFSAENVEMPKSGGFHMEPVTVFRTLEPMYQAFAVVTGSQIYRWRQSRQFCGRCGTRMEPGKRERSMVCPGCGLTEYPKICPAVIVAITNGDKLLMSRYARGNYRNYALIAGFVEVGETFEDCVRREVMEEVGLKVKNIRYFKSQPWASSDTVMVGFSAQLDGDDTIHLEEEELCEAGWFTRDEVTEFGRCLSVGNEMMKAFKEGTLGVRRKDYILFDLDGTLTDPKEGITKSVRHALLHFGIETENLDSLTPFIGPPLTDSYKKFYGLSDEQAWEGVLAYREYFSVRGWLENKEYPGIRELLKALKEAGKTLFVATSKPEEFARKITDYFGMTEYFDFIGGADMEETRVRKADVIRYVLSQYGLKNDCETVARCVMVGDREHDVLGARECGMDCVGVLYGYGSRQEMDGCRPGWVAGSVEELRNLLLRL